MLDNCVYMKFICIFNYFYEEYIIDILQNCNMDDLLCLSIMLDRLCFEMDKAYKEIKFQLFLFLVIFIVKDIVLVSVILVCIYLFVWQYFKIIYVNNKEGRF